MQRLGAAATEAEQRVEAAIVRIPGWAERAPRYALLAPAVVSPVHRGVEGEGWRVELEGGEAFFLKLAAEDMAAVIDPAAAAEAARSAAALGVTPALRHRLDGGRIVAFDLLDAPWRSATLDELALPWVLEGVVAAKRRLHAGPAFGRSRSPFEVIDAYESLCRRAAAPLPADQPWIAAGIAEVRSAIEAAGVDRRPCHGDGVASNVMHDGAGRVMLVDFDMAANADPYHDLGAFLTEAFAFDPGFREGLEAYAGRAEERLFNRCKLYGLVDDYLWALWGLYCFATSPRRHIEFVKYAEWRLLRCRMGLYHPQFEERLRRL